MPFVSRREKSSRNIENIFKMSAPVPHINPIPHGRSFHSNPDIRNWRCHSAHIRHFDQSQSFDGYERRTVGAIGFFCLIFYSFPKISVRCPLDHYCRTDFEAVTMIPHGHADRSHYLMEPFKFVLETAYG